MFENKYLKGLTPYKLSSHRAWELSIDTEVLKLDWNEATISPSPLVIERLMAALKNKNLNWYPDVNNITLSRKIAHYSQVSTEEVLYFPSSDSRHEYLIKAFIEPVDRILIIGPTYDNFRAVAESSGAVISYFYLDENFSLDFTKLHNVIDKINPNLLYIVNPNNPTGTFFPLEHLQQTILKYPNILFVVDEAYYEFIGQSVVGFALSYNNVIITRTFSKAFALASFRIGYAISCPLNIQILNKIRNAKNIPLLSQIAAEAALDSIEYTKKYVLEVSEAREFFYENLKYFKSLIPYKSYANFIFIKFISIETKYDLLRFLENYKIFVRDYKHVSGMENFIRITIGTRDQMEFVLEIIRNFFENNS